MPRPTISALTNLFARVGLTVFGGGDPTIAILQREFYRRDWLSPEKFAIAFGLARLTPGTKQLVKALTTSDWPLGRPVPRMPRREVDGGAVFGEASLVAGRDTIRVVV